MARRQVPDYVRAVLRQLPPPEAHVVPGSTPVFAFGDPLRAQVATLGINPSKNEFMHRGRLLTGCNRRLATLESLCADSLRQLTDEQILTIIQECNDYFQRRPYLWFKRLDDLLRLGTGASYYDGSACHLDLTPWATDPVWSNLNDAAKRALLDRGAPHLKAQLRHTSVNLVLMNGTAVVQEVRRLGLVDLSRGDVVIGDKRVKVYEGFGTGVRWLGWSINLQGSFGIGKSHIQQLGSWIRRRFNC
jgi:hypothetical protein